MEDEPNRALFVATQSENTLAMSMQRHEEVVALLLSKGSVEGLASNRTGRATRSLLLAQYEYVVQDNLEASRRWLRYVDTVPPTFDACAKYMQEAVHGQRLWNKVLLSLEGVELVICLLLLGDFDRIATEYEVVLNGEPLFQPADVTSQRAVLCRHLILHSQGRGGEMAEASYAQAIKRPQGTIFRDYCTLLLTLNTCDAASFNAELAKRAVAFRRRKSSKLIESTWGYGEAAQWCFDVVGTSICRLAHRQGIPVDNPDSRLYPEAFWLG